LDNLFRQQRELEQGTEQIDQVVKSLAQEKAQLELALESIVKRISESQKWLEENQEDKKIDPDNIVAFKDTWSQQAFEEVVKDHAIDDTMEYLQSALHNGKGNIEVSEYLKQIRNLARQQFFNRALALKIQRRQQEALTSRGGIGLTSNQSSGLPLVMLGTASNLPYTSVNNSVNPPGNPIRMIE